MKFLMVGNYTLEGIRGIKKERTKEVISMVEKRGGKVEKMLALLGEFDLVFIVDFPSIKEAIATSVELAKSTGIVFKTLPAVTIEEFDELTG